MAFTNWRCLIFKLWLLNAVLGIRRCDLAVVKGDLYIAGIFDVFGQKDGSCCGVNADSVMVLEAVRWYIEQLNKEQVLPFHIGFRGYKTCGMTSQAVHHAKHELSQETLVGLISANSNEEAKAIATLLAETRVPHISLCATATELGNRTAYPNFLRLLPDESRQIMVIIRIAERMRWQRMAVIYEDQSYAEIATALNSRLRAQARADSPMIQVGKHNSATALRTRLHAVIDEILEMSPFIEVVVYFGCKNTASVLFQELHEQEEIKDYVPRFVLPETSVWDGDIVRYLGSETPVAKQRPIIITPPYEEITCFSRHWMSLFTNMTLFENISAQNIWLSNVFAAESETNCNPVYERCTPFQQEDTTKKFRFQTLNVKYGIIAVHAMVKALRSIYYKSCQLNASELNCTVSNFKSIFNRRRDLLTDEMKDLKLEFSKDFNVTAEPLTTSNYTVSLKDKAEPVYSSDKEVYEIYTFMGDWENPKMTKVGSLDYNDTLSFNESAVRIHSSGRPADQTAQTEEDGRLSKTTVGLIVFGAVMTIVAILLASVVFCKYVKCRQGRLSENTYLTPVIDHGATEERSETAENINPDALQNLQIGTDHNTGSYAELTCSTRREGSCHDPQTNSCELSVLGAYSLTEEFCKAIGYNYEEGGMFSDSEKLWESV